MFYIESYFLINRTTSLSNQKRCGSGLGTPAGLCVQTEESRSHETVTTHLR